jgi:hypothetical protein
MASYTTGIATNVMHNRRTGDPCQRKLPAGGPGTKPDMAEMIAADH